MLFCLIGKTSISETVKSNVEKPSVSSSQVSKLFGVLVKGTCTMLNSKLAMPLQYVPLSTTAKISCGFTVFVNEVGNGLDCVSASAKVK